MFWQRFLGNGWTDLHKIHTAVRYTCALCIYWISRWLNTNWRNYRCFTDGIFVWICVVTMVNFDINSDQLLLRLSAPKFHTSKIHISRAYSKILRPCDEIWQHHSDFCNHASVQKSEVLVSQEVHALELHNLFYSLDFVLYSLPLLDGLWCLMSCEVSAHWVWLLLTKETAA